MAQRLGPRLIPIFPNEISDLILLELPFFDLMSGYFVSTAWKDFIDDNDEISKRMFRRPKRVRVGDEAARRDFTNSLWVTVYEKVGDDNPICDVWDHIDINPLFDDTDGVIHYEGYYSIESQEAFNASGLPKVPFHLRGQLTQLCDSMFVTYPPITRTIVNGWWRYSSLGGQLPRHQWVRNRKGITMGKLWDAMEGSTHATDMRLWPEKAWLEYRSDDMAIHDRVVKDADEVSSEEDDEVSSEEDDEASSEEDD